MGMSEGEEREKGTEEILEKVKTEKLPQINHRHQTMDPGSSKNTRQEKCQKPTLRHIIFKLQKIKVKEKNAKRSQSKKNPKPKPNPPPSPQKPNPKKPFTYRSTKVITSDFSKTMQAIREWSVIFEVLREKSPPP